MRRNHISRHPAVTAWLRLVCTVSVLIVLTTLVAVKSQRRSPYTDLLSAFQDGAVCTFLGASGPLALAGTFPAAGVAGVLWFVLIYTASRSNRQGDRRAFYAFLIIIILASVTQMVLGYTFSRMYQTAI